MVANEIARVYAKSFIDIGKEKGIIESLDEEMSVLAGIVRDDADLRALLASPNISKDSKKDFIQKVLSGSFSEITVNLINVLIDNDRQDLIPDVYEFMGLLIDDIKNRQRVTLVSSEALSQTLCDKIASELGSKLNKTIILKTEIDQNILGGIIIKIGDTVINGSLIKDLNNIKQTLLNSKVRREMAYED